MFFSILRFESIRNTHTHTQNAEKRIEILESISGSKSPRGRMTSLGPEMSKETHNKLIMLISVLNATYGSEGYDFSSLKYSNFVQLESYKEACAEVNSKFMRIKKIANENNFVDRMWKSIDDVIQIAKCNVFRYVPDLDRDPLSKRRNVPTLWSMNYFFHNNALNRVVYMACTSTTSALLEEHLSLTPPRSPSPITQRIQFENVVPRKIVTNNDDDDNIVDLTEDDETSTKTASNEDDKAESWEHEVATCDKNYEDFWDGKWEPCKLLDFDGSKYVTVKCKKDGLIVKNVRAHLVRLRKIEKRKKPSGAGESPTKRRRRSE